MRALRYDRIFGLQGPETNNVYRGLKPIINKHNVVVQVCRSRYVCGCWERSGMKNRRVLGSLGVSDFYR